MGAGFNGDLMGVDGTKNSDLMDLMDCAWAVPSDKRLHNYGKTHYFDWAIFNSYACHYQRANPSMRLVFEKT